MRATRRALRRLATVLEGTRFGARVAQAATGDPDWEAELARAGMATARVTPPDAVVAVIAKWDPTVLRHAGRAGCNYPDRALLPEGYPRDGDAAVAHLEALQRTRGVTHVVVPAVSAWWLAHYLELAERLGAPLWHDDDCGVYAVSGP
jgi:hypothetical protein